MFSTRTLAGLSALILLAACTAATPQRAPLALAIRNTDPTEPMRCVMVVAHFVSVDVPLVAPGETIRLDFSRVVDTGSLIVAAADGRDMEVENLLCGSDDRWSETRGDLPLLPLRAATTSRLEAACRLVPRLGCTINAP